MPVSKTPCSLSTSMFILHHTFTHPKRLHHLNLPLLFRNSCAKTIQPHILFCCCLRDNVGTTPSMRRKHIDGFVSNFGHALPFEKVVHKLMCRCNRTFFEKSPHSLHEPWPLPFFILETKRRCDNEESETARKTRGLYIHLLRAITNRTRDTSFATYAYTFTCISNHTTPTSHTITKIRLSFLSSSSPRTYPSSPLPTSPTLISMNSQVIGRYTSRSLAIPKHTSSPQPSFQNHTRDK
jgi:hypothetical protein